MSTTSLQPAPLVNVQLYEHQKTGVEWMMEQEKRANQNTSAGCTGGLLADDMGLGKTIQALTLIAKSHVGPTLVVCPLSLLYQWKEEAEKKVATSLRIRIYHGAERRRTANFYDYDIVLTTYSCLMYDHPAVPSQSWGARKFTWKRISCPYHVAGPLLRTKWLRVVLDEAQMIKNPCARTAYAARALSAQYRWCLSGTPVQNKVDEVSSIWSFLCPTYTLHRHSNDNVKLLQQNSIRRTKVEILPWLPGKTVVTHPIKFTDEEQEVSNKIQLYAKRLFKRIRRRGADGVDMAMLLLLLTRMRQVCDHTKLVKADMDFDPEAYLEEVEQDAIIHIQQQQQHKQQQQQVDKMMTVEQKEIIKKQAEAERLMELEEMKKLKKVDIQYSSKQKRIYRLLRKLRRSAPGEKVIIFSHFVQMLHLISDGLDKLGWTYGLFTGKLNLQERNACLENFRNNSNCNILLMSTKAGNVGLNLACANHVIHTEPWWNPFVDEQATDRVHRLGQKKHVYVHFFTIEQSIENRILLLQEKKKKMFNEIFSADNLATLSSPSRLGMREIGYLLG